MFSEVLTVLIQASEPSRNVYFFVSKIDIFVWPIYGITWASAIRPKKKLLCCPHPTKIWKLGRSVGIFFFFFFLRTVRELSFPIFLFKFLNGENSGGMQSKRISCKCFFKPLNTNFSKFFAQIWHKKKKKKKRPCFFAFYGRSGEGNITFFFGPYNIVCKVNTILIV